MIASYLLSVSLSSVTVGHVRNSELSCEKLHYFKSRKKWNNQFPFFVWTHRKEMKQKKTPKSKTSGCYITCLSNQEILIVTLRSFQPASFSLFSLSLALFKCVCVWCSYNGWSPELLCGCLVTIPLSLPVSLRVKDPFLPCFLFQLSAERLVLLRASPPASAGLRHSELLLKDRLWSHRLFFRQKSRDLAPPPPQLIDLTYIYLHLSVCLFSSRGAVSTAPEGQKNSCGFSGWQFTVYCIVKDLTWLVPLFLCTYFVILCIVSNM